MEKPGIPPPGYKRYPGGHFLAYDMRSGKFENLARVPFGDGILSMTMDTQRGRLYGITWPDRDLPSLRPHHQGAEKSRSRVRAGGERHRTSLPHAVPVARRRPQRRVGLSQHGRRRDSPLLLRHRLDRARRGRGSAPGHMGYNWGQTVWYAPTSTACTATRATCSASILASTALTCSSASRRSLRSAAECTPVQLRLSRLRARPRRPHPALPDRRPDLPQRKAGDEKGRHGEG